MPNAEKLSLTGARWQIAPEPSLHELSFADQIGLPPFLAKLLVSRGFTTAESVEKFLRPSLDDLHPASLLPDFEAGLAEVLGAKERGETIFVHGDYDVDGVTSAALLTRFLRSIGATVEVFVPHRLKDGYGVNRNAVTQAKNLGASLFLTCDCGISAHESVAMAREAGMRVVITDHHEVGSELPAAHAVINPQRHDSRYPFSDLAGVGVAFKFCAGITEALGHPLRGFYRGFLDLVTLGTVADVMPLVDENRIIVSHGLPMVQESQKPGIQALINKAFSAKPLERGQLNARHIGFQLGPRLNAAGRMDDAALALELLLSRDPEEALRLAQVLEDHNTNRRRDQDEMMAEALDAVSKLGQEAEHALVLAGQWHPGLIGIVAGRLAEQFHRPVFLMGVGQDLAKGSARSIPGYHLADALNRVHDILMSHGGHEQAAGFSVAPGRIMDLQRALFDDARQHITPEMMLPVLTADAQVEVAETTLDAARALSRLQPFGQANREPVLISKGLRLIALKPTKNPNVFQFTVQGPDGHTADAVSFRHGEIIGDLKPGTQLDLAFALSLDSFRGVERVKWLVQDLRLA